jgi:hypothetical protein
MDFVPNALASFELSKIGISEARSALLAIFAMVLLPWYGWLLYFERNNPYAAHEKAKQVI